MKKLKLIRKAFAMALAIAMMMVVAVPAMAGTITINNSLDGSNYYAYKIFDVTYSGDSTTESSHSNYAYTISSGDDWYNDVVKYITGSTAGTAGELPSGTYTSVPTDTSSFGNGLRLEKSVDGTTWNVSFDSTFSAKTFAEYLDDYKSGKTSANADAVEGTGGNITISVSEAGYYFVTTSLGAFCMLDTADDSVTIDEKNTFPQIDKAAGEYTATYDSVTKKYTVTDPATETTTASIGDVVKYNVLIEAGAGATGDYYIADYGKGLAAVTSINTATGATGNIITAVEYYNGETSKWTAIDSNYYELVEDSSALTMSSDSKTTIANKTELFTLRIKNEAIKDFIDGTPIRVSYQTTVTAAAITDSSSTDTPNKDDSTAVNAAVLIENEYNTNNSKPSSTNVTEKSTESVNVKNYDFDIIKFYNNNGSYTILADATGAKFELYTKDDTTGTYNEVKLTYDSTNGYYRPIDSTAATAETEATYIDMSNTSDTGAMDGFGKVRGLASGTYYLKEEAAPNGYNLMTDYITVTLNDNDNVVTKLSSGSTYGTGDSDTQTVDTSETGIKIENKTGGSEIPATGGIGTVIFYVVGAMLLVGAGVLLITRRKTGTR